MTMRADFHPCPCGSPHGPLPVIERGARKLRTIRVRCRACKLTSPSARPDRVVIAWNVVVERELARRRSEAGVA
jgi:hypothetical protein